jgi:ribonuclease HI
MGTNLDTFPDLYLSVYHELISEKYEDYTKIFTDGSKQKNAVAAAAVVVNKVLVKRLPDHASIFSAEAQAILLALNIISQSSNQHSPIPSDSLSCVKAIKNRNLNSPLIVEILERLHQQLRCQPSITFVWIPSHIGIAGNTVADVTAKPALNLPM